MAAPTTIRMKAIPANGFRHGGLVVGKAWVPFKVADITPKMREALQKFHGRFVMVHEEDRPALVELGLAFDGPKEPLVEAKPAKKAPDPKGEDKNGKSGPAAAGKDK